MNNNQQKLLEIFTDGASRGNPGLAGIGFVIKLAGKTLMSHGYQIQATTNNVAEYLALLAALHLVKQEFLDLDWTTVTIKADSELLIKQMLGLYKVKNERLAKIHRLIKQVIREINKPHEFVHIRREFNSEADRMANNAIDKKLTTPPWLEELKF